MPLRLRVLPRADQNAGAGAGEVAPTERVVEFADDVDEIRIGRRAELELTLPFKALSGLHARLVRQKTSGGERGHTWLLEDLESKNGTFVGKSRVKPGEQRLMFAGDKVDLGPVKVLFDGHSQPTPNAEGTATIARRLVSDLLHASPGASAPTLSVISGTSEVETLKLVDRDRPYFIGRARTCDLSFPYDELSRQHASFTRTWNGVVLRDQGSKNGILVNGNLVATTQRLSNGDEIEMGPLKLRLMDPEDKYLKELEGPDRAERAPRGDGGPKPVVVMPAALAVSLPPTPTPPPPAAEPGPGETPRKVSRLAPRPVPSDGTASPAPRSSAPGPALFDEHHPALAARRPPADPDMQAYEHDVGRARKTMWFAAAVLFAILAAVVYLTLGSGSE
jgi:pSer/pThr/pTyr-binding forkhead associated (FHA) protein